MAELRLGFVGLGSAGRRRLAAARRHPRVRVVAGHDPRGLPEGLAAGDPLRDVDAVVVAVPPGAAAGWIAAARDRGLAVLAEKPPTTSAAALRSLLGAGPPLRVGFNHRQHHAMQALAALLRRGALGALTGAEGRYARPYLARPGDWRADPAQAGGGILLDQGIHLVDAFRWLLGPLRPVRWRVEGAPMETAVEAELDAGVPVRLSSRADAPFRFALRLRGEGGTATVQGLATSSSAYAPERLRWAPRGGPAQVQTWHDDPSWDREMDGFVRHVLDGDDDGHGAPSDALAVLELVDALRRPEALEEAC